MKAGGTARQRGERGGDKHGEAGHWQMTLRKAKSLGGFKTRCIVGSEKRKVYGAVADRN